MTASIAFTTRPDFYIFEQGFPSRVIARFKIDDAAFLFNTTEYRSDLTLDDLGIYTWSIDTRHNKRYPINRPASPLFVIDKATRDQVLGFAAINQAYGILAAVIHANQEPQSSFISSERCSIRIRRLFINEHYFSAQYNFLLFHIKPVRI